MSKAHTKKSKLKPPSKEWPAVVYFWAFGLAIFGYLVGRLALDAWPHPYHWLSALAGGLAGIPHRLAVVSLARRCVLKTIGSCVNSCADVRERPLRAGGFAPSLQMSCALAVLHIPYR